MKTKTKILIIIVTVILAVGEIVLSISIPFLSLLTGFNPIYAFLSNVAYPEYYEYTGPCEGSIEEIYEFYYKYDEEWIIGRTSEEIQEKCGTFDNAYIDKNGNGTGSYTILERGWMGGDYILTIYFEKNIATKIVRDFYI